MTNLESEILEALLTLERAVESMSIANPKPRLQPLFERLDELTGRLPIGSDPNLLHYLHKKSYQKARLLLEGRDSENVQGSCGHV